MPELFIRKPKKSIVENQVKQLHELAQSIRLDIINRKIVNSGELQKLIASDGLKLVTFNPAIFAKAISSTNYDKDIARLAQEGKSNDTISGMSVKNIWRAADLFKMFTAVYPLHS